MSRIPRENIKTNYFHNMVQGINKNFIFDNSIDIKYYIKLLYELKNEHNIKIIAYCIMNNHAHILVQVQDIKELGKYMQRINTRFSLYYNKKYNKVGYVFRDRYKSQGIYTEKQFYNCIRYIFNNPVKAGICNKPEEYLFSNVKFFKINSNANQIENDYFIDTEEDIEKCFLFDFRGILQNKGITNEELINHKNELKCIVEMMKCKYGYSLREISDRLNIGRETIRKIYKE